MIRDFRLGIVVAYAGTSHHRTVLLSPPSFILDMVPQSVFNKGIWIHLFDKSTKRRQDDGEQGFKTISDSVPGIHEIGDCFEKRLGSFNKREMATLRQNDQVRILEQAMKGLWNLHWNRIRITLDDQCRNFNIR